MPGRDLEVACRCGAFRARLHGASARSGQRVQCHCSDCQAFARHLGGDGLLDANGGTAIYQTLPGRLEFVAGAEQLACMRLTPKGLLRWYARCCGTPMGNMLAKPGFGFVGLPLVAFPGKDAVDAVGPLIASIAAAEAPRGSNPPADFGRLRVMRRVLVRHFASKVGLAPKGSPYFDAKGRPIAPPHILTAAELSAAYGLI